MKQNIEFRNFMTMLKEYFLFVPTGVALYSVRIRLISPLSSVLSR